MTLKEYLEDYASEDTKRKGEAVIRRELGNIPNPVVKEKAGEYLKELHASAGTAYSELFQEYNEKYFSRIRITK